MKHKENVGIWIGVVFVCLPAAILAGFFPEFNILPTWAWTLIAVSGATVAGAYSSDKTWIGAIAGAAAGLGAILGLIGYVSIRESILPTTNFLRLEVAIGALIGAAPGLVAFHKLARNIDGQPR